MAHFPFVASVPELLKVLMNRLGCLLTEDTERHVFAMDELGDMKEQDVKLRSDLDGEVLTRFLEVVDEANKIVVKTHSK